MSMLEIKNVHKSFFTYTRPRLQAGIFHRPGARKVTSELQVLRGVDLTVEKGDVVAILGPSGSGKTTLLRCLNFLETADAGQLTFDGETFDLAQASRADIARLRKKTAFVFQSYNLFRPQHGHTGGAGFLGQLSLEHLRPVRHDPRSGGRQRRARHALHDGALL